MTYQLWAGEVLTELGKLAAGSIRCVATSPPYNLGASPSGLQHPGAERGRAINWRGYESDPDDLPDAEYQDQQVALLEALYRVCGDQASVFYVHTPRLSGGRMFHPLQWLFRGPFAVRQEIVWAQNTTHQWDGSYFPPTSERVYWLVKGNDLGRRLPVDVRRYTDVWFIPPEQAIPWHPAPFPVALAARCVLAGSEPGDTVLDPYCGSGTTGVAALQHGRRFIGIDRQGTYLDKARARLDRVDPLFTVARPAQGHLLFAAPDGPVGAGVG